MEPWKPGERDRGKEKRGMNFEIIGAAKILDALTKVYWLACAALLFLLLQPYFSFPSCLFLPPLPR